MPHGSGTDEEIDRSDTRDKEWTTFEGEELGTREKTLQEGTGRGEDPEGSLRTLSSYSYSVGTRTERHVSEVARRTDVGPPGPVWLPGPTWRGHHTKTLSRPSASVPKCEPQSRRHDPG